MASSEAAGKKKEASPGKRKAKGEDGAVASGKEARQNKKAKSSHASTTKDNKMARDSKKGKDFKSTKDSPKKKPTFKKSSSPGSDKKKSSSKQQPQQPFVRARKHAEVVTQAKLLWNQLRQKSNTKAQNQDLMKELMPLIQGKVVELCRQHDAARVVQAAMQFGTPEQRTVVIQELTAEPGTLAELSKSSYAHFCVLKAIQYGHVDEANCTAVVKNLRGSISQLAVHATACRVVEALCTTLPNKRWGPLKIELYGPHMKLLSIPTTTTTTTTAKESDTTTTSTNTTVSLAACLKQAPDHQKSCLDFIGHLVHKGMEKNLYALTYFQELLCEYQQQLLELSSSSGNGTEEVTKLLQSTPTACESAVHLLSSRAGVRVACDWIAYGTAKDRKTIAKSLKGFGKSGLIHPQAYLCMLQLVRVTDDTVLVFKNFLNELVTPPPPAATTTTVPKSKKEEAAKEAAAAAAVVSHPLLELALSDSASKLFIMIMLLKDSDALQKTLDPYEWEVLGQVPTLPDGTPTFKKNVAIKQDELFKYLQQPLVDLATQHARELLLSRAGSLVLKLIYQSFRTPLVVKAVIDACLSDITILQDKMGHLSIKHMILADAVADAGDDDKSASLFSQAFLQAYPDITELALQGNRGAFVVAALYQVPAIQKKIKLNVKKLRSNEQAAASAGIQALLKQVDV